MRMQHLHFLDSMSYLAMSLRKLPEAYGLLLSKSWYPYYFNTKANLDYVSSIAYIWYFGADEMGRETEGTSCLGMTSRKTRSLITDACWNSIAKMTSPYCERCVRFSCSILWKLEISRFS